MILNKEQTLIRDTARAFARDRLAPNAAAWDRDVRVTSIYEGTNDFQRIVISRAVLGE